MRFFSTYSREGKREGKLSYRGGGEGKEISGGKGRGKDQQTSDRKPTPKKKKKKRKRIEVKPIEGGKRGEGD